TGEKCQRRDIVVPNTGEKCRRRYIVVPNTGEKCQRRYIVAYAMTLNIRIARELYLK
ncbi:hypothetical protein AVEN_198597-1, partial [Araneus ventricosus]